MPANNRRQRSVPDIWPGFVDAFSALLIIIIFLLMVFTLAQYFLSEALSGRDAALDRLNRTVAELQDMLALERRTAEELRRNLSQTSDELQASIAARDRLSSQLAKLIPERDSLKSQLETRTARTRQDGGAGDDGRGTRQGSRISDEEGRGGACGCVQGHSGQ